MTECKFLNSGCKCYAISNFSQPTGVSIMGYCMVVVENVECDWFTEEVE